MQIFSSVTALYLFQKQLKGKIILFDDGLGLTGGIQFRWAFDESSSLIQQASFLYENVLYF